MRGRTALAAGPGLHGTMAWQQALAQWLGWVALVTCLVASAGAGAQTKTSPAVAQAEGPVLAVVAGAIGNVVGPLGQRVQVRLQLLQRHLPQAVDGLFFVPGTLFPQVIHDLHQALKSLSVRRHLLQLKNGKQ